MPQIINTNIPSINAQRNLDRSGSSLAVALQRLSSGLRINSAKDDAAGLAISERFTTQIRGLSVAIRNANDGISLSQTAEGALGEVGQNLQRIRELAVQARNATNSASDRAALDAEVQQRLMEIDRTAAQTSFNGQKILDGSFGNATFQVGANAGEFISLTLETSMRLNALGAISSATSAVLGGASAGGSYAVSPTLGDYTALGTPATNGSLTLSPATRNFGTLATNPQVDGTNSFDPTTLSFGTPIVEGTSSPIAANTLLFGTVASPQVDGSNTQGPITDFDYSGGGANIAQFDVDGIGVTLTANYTDADGVAAAIEAQLQAVDPTYTVTNTAGTLTFSRTGSLTAVAITNADANATTAGFANSAGTAGTAAVATTNATFQVDGFPVTLDQDYASYAALAADIDAKLGAFYTAAEDPPASGNIVISRTNNTSPVVISAPDAVATAAGITASAGVTGTPATPATFEVDGTLVTLSTTPYADEAALAADIQSQLAGYTVAGVLGGAITITNTGDINAVAITNANAQAVAAGITNSAGTAGSAATVATVATFDVDGTPVTLNQNYATYDDVAAAIQTQIGAGFDVQNDAGTITITRTDTPGATSTAVALTNPNAYATTVGLAAAAGTAGVDATAAAALGFSVDGNAVVLDGNYATYADMAADIQSQLSGYTVTGSGSGITIVNNSAGSTAPVITAAAGAPGTNATAAGLLAGVGTNGTVNSITLAPGEFTIQLPPSDPVDMAGTYDTPQEFAEAINNNASGVYASINDDGTLLLRSAREFILGGTAATTTLGFTGTLFQPTTGNLSAVNVLTPEAADEVILRVDAALTSVSGLRSNFGAIQNRFESTINNLQTTSENLQASRSRILDADFAQETAELTRAQILQQAGTAILAQANQLPQNVLQLLG